MNSDIEKKILQTLKSVCPTFEASRILVETGKCLLIHGSMGEFKAIAKCLIHPDDYWKQLFLQEISTYQNFQEFPPPFTVPRCLFVDLNKCILILEFIDGQPLGNERYANKPLPKKQFDILLKDLCLLHQWKAPFAVSPSEIVKSYKARIRKYVELGFLNNLDFLNLSTLLDSHHWIPEFNHGDLLLMNCFALENQIVFIDWEFSGLYLSGYDLALLWIILCFDPYSRQLIEDTVEYKATSARIAFTINQAVILARELKIYNQLPNEKTRNERIKSLEQDLNKVRYLIQEYQQWITNLNT
jgi:hypothetical protein